MTVLSSRIVRLMIVIALLGAVLPGVVAGRLVRVQAQEADATPEAGAAAGLATAAVAPADALAYLAVTLDPDSDQITRSEDLLARAGVADLFEDLMGATAADAVPVDDLDLAALLDGEVALVVTEEAVAAFAGMAEDAGSAVADTADTVATPPAGAATPDAGTDDDATTAAPAGFAGVLRPGDPDAAAARLEELLVEDARSRDIAVVAIEVGGVTITSLPPDEFGDGGVAVARLGDIFVFSAAPADLEPFVAVFAGDEPALADDEAFGRARTALPDDFLAYGFVNGPAVRAGIDPLIAAAVAELGGAGSALVDAQLASLDAYSAFMLRADDPGFRFESVAFPAPGAEPLPVPASGEVTLDAQVPGDSLLFAGGFELGASLATSLDAVALLLAQVAVDDPSVPFTVPADATEAEQITAVYELLGRLLTFNPRTDLVDQLVGEWAFALSVRSLEDPNGIGAVFTSGVGDETLLTDATTKLAVYINFLALALGFGLLEESELPREFTGGTHTEEVVGALTQVVEIPIPTGSDMSGEPTIVRLQWGIIDGRFVFGVNDGFADLVTEAGGDAGVLADNPRYQAVMAELPTAQNGVFYLDLGGIIALLQPLIDEAFAEQDALSPGATPDAAISAPDLSGIEAFAVVGYTEDDLQGVSALLLIGE